MSWPGSILAPHQGQFVNWAGEPLPLPLVLAAVLLLDRLGGLIGRVRRRLLADPEADAERLFAPLLLVASADRSRRRRSGRWPAGTAGSSAAAACTASARPRRARPSARPRLLAAAAGPSCRPTGPGRLPSCRRPWGTRAGRPRLRSRPCGRVWSSLVMPGRLSRMKANWNGYHERLAGTSMAFRSASSSRRRFCEKIVWIRCCHMARLANRNASAAFSSSCQQLQSGLDPRRAFRQRSSADWPGFWYRAMSGFLRSACRSLIHAS